MKRMRDIIESVELVPNEMDVRMARSLQQCKLPYSPFVRQVSAALLVGEMITIRQHVQLWKMAYRLRRQIGDGSVLALAGLWQKSTVMMMDGSSDIVCGREKQGMDGMDEMDKEPSGLKNYEVKKGVWCWEVVQVATGKTVRTGLASRSEATRAAWEHENSDGGRAAAESAR